MITESHIKIATALLALAAGVPLYLKARIDWKIAKLKLKEELQLVERDAPKTNSQFPRFQRPSIREWISLLYLTALIAYEFISSPLDNLSILTVLLAWTALLLFGFSRIVFHLVDWLKELTGLVGRSLDIHESHVRNFDGVITAIEGQTTISREIVSRIGPKKAAKARPKKAPPTE